MSISSVKTTFRSYLPGDGFDTNGNPKQGKMLVVGEIDGSYTSGGEPLTPADLGLKTIDNVVFGKVRTNGDSEPGASNPRQGHYDTTNQKLFLYADGSTQASAAAFLVDFFAFGDSADDSTLL